MQKEMLRLFLIVRGCIGGLVRVMEGERQLFTNNIFISFNSRHTIVKFLPALMRLVRNFTLILLLLMNNGLYSQEMEMYPCRTACNIGIQIGDFKSSDTITVAALLKAERVNAEVGRFTILSYRITLDCSGFEDLYEVSNPGDKFCEQAILAFRKLRRGSFMS